MIGFIEIRTKKFPGMKKSEFNRGLKGAWAEAGEHWHRRFLKKHFANAATREYSYRPRQGEAGNPHPKGFKRSYTGKKLKKYGHTRPLELTGTGRAMAEKNHDVRSTSKGVRVVMRAPVFNFRSKKSLINMRNELTTVSAPEAKAISKLIEGDLTDFLSNHPTEERIIITGR